MKSSAEQWGTSVNPDQARHLRELEEQLLHPETRSSPEAVAELLAEGFVEIGSSGIVFDRAQILESLDREPPIRRTISDFKAIALSEGVVLVTYLATRDRGPGKPAASSLRSSIWKSIDGQWKMAFHQGTLTKGE